MQTRAGSEGRGLLLKPQAYAEAGYHGRRGGIRREYQIDMETKARGKEIETGGQIRAGHNDLRLDSDIFFRRHVGR